MQEVAMPAVCAHCGANDRAPLGSHYPDDAAPADRPEDWDRMSARDLILSALQDPEPAMVPLCAPCALAAGESETTIWGADSALCTSLGLPADWGAPTERHPMGHPLVVYAMPGAAYGSR